MLFVGVIIKTNLAFTMDSLQNYLLLIQHIVLNTYFDCLTIGC